eukprot:1157523-Pelagomonas_calceolata.AAC.7
MERRCGCRGVTQPTIKSTLCCCSQREADAAKDAAWRQLKSVVNKISELAQAPASTPAAS